MIRIQKLKEPKKTSGQRLEKGKKLIVRGITLVNGNAFPVYVDTFERKGRDDKNRKAASKKKSTKKSVTKSKPKAAASEVGAML